MKAEAEVIGFSGGAGALAGSFAFAYVTPSVSTSLGAGSNVTTGTGNVRFRSRHNVGDTTGAKAQALAGSGGMLIPRDGLAEGYFSVGSAG